jgi:hypothetical protein
MLLDPAFDHLVLSLPLLDVLGAQKLSVIVAALSVIGPAGMATP